MSSLHSEPDEMLTSNVAASQELTANRRVQTLDVAAMALRYRPFLKAIAAAELPEHLKSREDDSDLVQEVLLKATRDANQFRGSTEKELEAWLREILINQITDCVRFHGRQQRDVGVEIAIPLAGLSADDLSASELVRKAEAKELTQRALHELPDDYRSVLLMRQQLDLSFIDIAERMQRSPDAVRMLWGRAILALGEKLKSLK
jgi:RNA polymerase sigma-70 factor (ECF subfamily)